MDSVIATESVYHVPGVHSTLFWMLLQSLMKQKHTPNTARKFSKEYDYIVVGAGTAGSVVASRLSEIPCVSVLLLEAGKVPPLLTDVPGFSRSFWNTDIDWQYKTVPQKNTGNALNNNQVAWPSGKTVGGSSTMGAMLYVRGNPKDYDEWEAEGAKGWSYKAVYPYFIRMEDNKDPEYIENGYHGVGGPLTVQRPWYQSEIREPLFQTAKSLGYKLVDPNGPDETGFYDQQATLRSGLRCSTAKAYLVPAENRANLDILTNARVRKVLIKNQKAVGVVFDYRNRTRLVRANKEVILSAGAINTPQILMLSGIGPKKHLDKFKIPMIANLPVGKNLQDHFGSNINFLLSPTIAPLKAKMANPVNIEEFIRNRTGPLGTSEGVAVMAFLKDCPKQDFPNQELYFAEIDSELGRHLGVTPKTYAQLYAPLEGKAAYTCLAHLLKPRSRGAVTLHSTDPYDPPLIDPKYYEDPKDIEDVIEGLKNCLRVGTHPEMICVGSTVAPGLIPGCEKFSGDEYLKCQVKSIVYTLNHQCGTARMGDPRDYKAVVDPKLRVKGIQGLRVVDASVMPIVPSGNTGVATILVAEKASDIIKSSITCQKETPNKDSYDE